MESPKDQKKVRTAFGIVVVLCGFLLFFSFGSVYAHGNMAPYIISYTRMRSIDPQRNAVQLSASPWLYGGAVITQGLSMSLGGWLIQKIGPRPTAILAAAIFTSSTFLTALTVRLSFWAAVVTNGLLTGFGLGLGYVAPFYSAMQWLPRHTGLAIGLVMMGMGGSSFAYIPLQTAFINPNDEEPNYQPDAYADFFYFTQEDVLDRVPYMFIILGTLYAVIQLISIPFIVEYRDVELSSRSYSSVLVYIWHVLKPRVPKCCPEKPEGDTSLELSDRGKGESPEGSIEPKRSSSSDNSNSSVQESEDKPNVKPLELLKRWDFYLIWISMFTLAESLTYFTSVYKIFGQSAKFSDHTLALVGSFGFVCNCGGRVLWGLFADQVPSKVVLVLIMGGLSALIYTVYITPLAGLALYGLWVAFMYFLFGGAMSVYPTCCAVWYGRVHMSTNYGLLFSSHSFGSVVAIVVSTYGHHALGWMGQFFLTASLCFVGVMFIIIAGERETPKKKDDS